MIDIDVDTTGFQTFQGTLSDLQAEAFISPGLEERITNEAEYAGYVVGLDASPDGRSGARGNQPWTWRYGWPRLVKVAQEVMDNWITFMEAKAQELWER